MFAYSGNVYGGDKTKPIAANTVLTLDKESGKILNAWGSMKFFLPHMLTIDGEDNVWMTDVALHQVFKYGPNGGNGEPLITLGTKVIWIILVYSRWCLFHITGSRHLQKSYIVRV